MKPTKSPHILLTLTLLAFSSRLAYADPLDTTFTYQGQLQQSGTPVNGPCDFQFSLWDAVTNGALIGTTETLSTVSVTNGMFTVALNFGTEAFNGEARWLEISVRAGTNEFTVLGPRQPVTATPYAIRAQKASSASTVTGSVPAALLTGAIPPANIGAGSITSAMMAPGSVNTTSLADGVVTDGKVFTVPDFGRPPLTFTNPTPAADEAFGTSVAFVGTDKVIIGAYLDNTGGTKVGAAYLFSTEGMLLTTFTNPTPVAYSRFGLRVAAVGADKVLISADLAQIGGLSGGRAYLFSITGKLLTTFSNPTPQNDAQFGSSLATVGTDMVLIGARRNDIGATDAGAAYLFSTNGMLLRTFTNPTPAVGDEFGKSVAAVGTDKILIGAWRDNAGATNSGAAYLFSTNGMLLRTFTNPTPSLGASFGCSVAAVGSDKVIIGAYLDDAGATDSGAAYLFSTNGMLLRTFTNPTPAVGDMFGVSVATVGTNWVLLGGLGDSAYLFNTDGKLLTTFSNPNPSNGAQFGNSVAAVGTDKVLVGASGAGIGAPGAGAVYLFLSVGGYTPGLVSDGVRSGSIVTASLANGAVTAADLASDAASLSKVTAGNMTLGTGNVGIGKVPSTKLDVGGDIYADRTIRSAQGSRFTVNAMAAFTVDAGVTINVRADHYGGMSVSALAPGNYRVVIPLDVPITMYGATPTAWSVTTHLAGCSATNYVSRTRIYNSSADEATFTEDSTSRKAAGQQSYTVNGPGFFNEDWRSKVIEYQVVLTASGSIYLQAATVNFTY